MNEYKLMIAPFNHNGFRSLSKKQAEEYFHWYVGQSKARIEQLYEYTQSTGGAAFYVNIHRIPLLICGTGLKLKSTW